MLKSPMIPVIAAAALLLAAFPAQAAELAGHARESRGTVKVLRAGAKEAKALRRGDDVFVDDTITTGKDSRVKIVLGDDGELVMAENGKLVVDKFVYDPKKPREGQAEFTLLDAAFSYIGGWMGKDAGKSDVKMNLNFGAIGIRGTRLLRAMHNRECWIYLEKGKVDVYNKGGKVTLLPGDGTIMRNRKVSPEKPHRWTREEIKWIKQAVAGREEKEWP